MNQPMTIACQVNFKRQDRGRRRLDPGAQPHPRPPGRVPRVARLMALAIRFEAQVRKGVLRSYSALAELGHVTRARQIMNLVKLAPDIQEALLFLPRTERGRAPIILRDVLPIATTIEWGKQRRMWQRLVATGRS
jgi:hypothetical protein